MTTKHTILQMATATGAGFGISLSDIETGLRILSLSVGIIYSTVVFIRTFRKKDKKDT